MDGTQMERHIMSGRTDPMDATGEDIPNLFKAMYKRQAERNPSMNPPWRYSPLLIRGCWGSPPRIPAHLWWKQGLKEIAGIVRTAFVVNYGGFLLRVTMAPRPIARHAVAWPAVVHGFLAWHANLHGYILPFLWLYHHFLQ